MEEARSSWVLCCAESKCVYSHLRVLSSFFLIVCRLCCSKGAHLGCSHELVATFRSKRLEYKGARPARDVLALQLCRKFASDIL